MNIHIRIIASTFQQIPGLSGTFNLNFQDFSGPKSFSKTFQVLEILQKKIQDCPGGVGTLEYTHFAIFATSNLFVTEKWKSEHCTQAAIRSLDFTFYMHLEPNWDFLITIILNQIM